MFDFEGKLQEGALLRQQAEQNIEQIATVYRELASSLSKFLNKEIEFTERKEVKTRSFNRHLGALAYFSSFVEDETTHTGYKLISARLKDEGEKKTEVLFRTKEPKEGYPVTIDHEDEEMICYNQDELVRALKNVVSSVDFHNKLQKLIKDD
ncbi:hypothetical protein ACVD5Z_002011 [Vibrio fluvialis]